MKLHTIPIAIAIALSCMPCNNCAAATEVGNENALPAVSKHEELATRFMDTMKELATIITAVTDLESANAATTKISKLSDRIDKIVEELKPLDPPAKELKEAINKKMEASDAEVQKVMGEKLQKTMKSLSPDARQVLQKAVGEFFGKLDVIGKEFERHFGDDDESGSKQPADGKSPKPDQPQR